MKFTLCTAVFLTLSGFSQAWWFFKDDPIYPQTDVDESCVESAQIGTCEIYNCIQRRFPCEGHSFAQNHGLNFCQRFNDYRSLFNDEGQAWALRTQRCLAGLMLEEYRQPSTTCKRLNRVGWDIMSTCYVREGFCEIARENREALWAILQARDLGHTIRIWREIVEIAVRCGGNQLRIIRDWARGKVASMLVK